MNEKMDIEYEPMDVEENTAMEVEENTAMDVEESNTMPETRRRNSENSSQVIANPVVNLNTQRRSRAQRRNSR